MKLHELQESTTPLGLDQDKIISTKYKQNGDKSYTARIEFESGRVNVHSNKNLSTLQKLVKDRYTNATFHK